MATLRDYLAYARSYLHPSLSEEAGQALVQAYVGEGVGLIAMGVGQCREEPTHQNLYTAVSECVVLHAFTV